MEHTTGPAADGPELDELLAGIEPGRALRIDLVTWWEPIIAPGVILSTVDLGAPRRKARPLWSTAAGHKSITHADLLEFVAGALRLADEHAAQRELGPRACCTWQYRRVAEGG